MNPDWLTWWSYALVGVTLGVATLPISGGENPLTQEKGISYVLLCGLMWPTFIWLVIQWYRCWWADYLMICNHATISEKNRELHEYIDNHAMLGIAAGKERFDKIKAIHERDVAALEEKSRDRRYFLETQTRKGVYPAGRWRDRL